MNIPHKQLSVDINRKNQYTVDFIGHVNDKDVRYIDVTFNAGGTPITLEEGCTATVTYVSEGVLIDQAAVCTVSGSTVVIGIDSEKVENLRSGILEVQPKVVDPNGRILTMQIPILVRISPDIAEHGQVDDDSLGSYAEVVREIAAARGDYTDLKDRLDHTGVPTDEQVAEAVEEYLEEHPPAGNFEIVSHKKDSISNQSQTGDSDTFYPTVGAVRDFVDYVKGDLEDYVEEAVSPKQDKLTAGKNITIENGVISAIESTSCPIPVIFDTDFWTDVDDAVAIRELIWAERQGICDIVGVIVDAVNSNSAKAFARYLDYEGRGDLQFALEKNATDYSGTPSYFNTIISSWSTGIYESNNDAPDENEGEYYIKLLQSLPEGKKCRIICVGYLSALAGLLNRAEQNQQIMNLIINKVEKIFIMGGKYPSGSENNFNRNARAKTAAHNVCSKCPSQIPIVFLGYEVGESVTSGGTTGTAIGNFDLLYKCMVAHGEGSNGRSSWDPMTVLLALADDANQSGYTYTRGTNVVNSSTGANTFTANDNGSHYYVTKKYPDAWYGKFIDSICERKAWSFRKVGDLSYNEQLVLQSIAVTTNPSTPTYVGETFNTTGMVVTGTYLTSGGETIQKQVYNYSYSPNTALSAGSQTITITYTEKEVTATTTITITVLEYPVYNITTSVTNGTYSGSSTISPNGTATVTVAANVGYSLPSTITVTGATYNYDSTTGTITLSNPTENVTISVTCTISEYATVTLDGTENWQFNIDSEPNTYGFYNCYILGAIPDNIKYKAAVSENSFREASCNNSYFNRNINGNREPRTATNSPGFGFFAQDPSLYFRFDNTIATTAAGFKTYLTNNPIQITYKTNS